MTARKNECARFESVWDAICDTPQQAQNMKLRAELMHGIRLAMQRQNLSQAAAGGVREAAENGRRKVGKAGK